MSPPNRVCNFSHDSLPGVTLKISSSIPLTSPRDLEIIASKLQQGKHIPEGIQGVLRFRLDGDSVEDAAIFPL